MDKPYLIIKNYLIIFSSVKIAAELFGTNCNWKRINKRKSLVENNLLKANNSSTFKVNYRTEIANKRLLLYQHSCINVLWKYFIKSFWTFRLILRITRNLAGIKLFVKKYEILIFVY